MREAQALGVEVIDRCNLTVLQEPGQEDLAEFLAEHKVLFRVHAWPALCASPSSRVGVRRAACLLPQHHRNSCSMPERYSLG